ncbi:unnamed protein product [Cuscuta epithymum]|uniref:Uncharacterized protein n=1 Tax=Cuscuta epithymum TaxID=186058 RepID=A0AAV0DHN5_9ASTE|nr:unnamed protein product [Cuscuta epithymum]
MVAMRGRCSISALEGGASSDMEFATIEATAAAGSLDASFIFHIVVDIIGFALFMHEQIPSILQDLTSAFDELQAEFEVLGNAVAQEETKGSIRRKHASRKREVRVSIRKFEKFMKTISNLKTALQLMITAIPSIESVLLVLGSTPLRPLHVYELQFPCGGRVVSGDFSRSRVAETLSKKAIRELVSRGAGSSSYPGATKLYLLVRAPSSVSLPLHFIPKRDFRFRKKVVVPFKLRFKCIGTDDNQDGDVTNFTDCAFPEDIIWFQCRHVIKGLACRTSPSEED